MRMRLLVRSLASRPIARCWRMGRGRIGLGIVRRRRSLSTSMVCPLPMFSHTENKCKIKEFQANMTYRRRICLPTCPRVLQISVSNRPSSRKTRQIRRRPLPLLRPRPRRRLSPPVTTSRVPPAPRPNQALHQPAEYRSDRRLGRRQPSPRLTVPHLTSAPFRNHPGDRSRGQENSRHGPDKPVGELQHRLPLLRSEQI